MYFYNSIISTNISHFSIDYILFNCYPFHASMFLTSILLLLCLILPTGIFHTLQNPFFSTYFINLFGMKLGRSFHEARDCFSCMSSNRVLVAGLHPDISFRNQSKSYSSSLFSITALSKSTSHHSTGKSILNPYE